VSKVLVVHDGKRERELLLVERLVVGRDPMCDLSHDDSLLSRRHAEFASSGDEVTVRDLGSRNGLFVNGTRTAERALRPGDIVTIGPLRVRYVMSSAPVSLTPDELDSGSTKVIPSALPRPATIPPAPPPVSEAVSVPVLEDIMEEDSDEEETRVVQVSDWMPEAAAAGDDLDEAEATMMVPAADLAPSPTSTATSAAGATSATLLLATPAASPKPAPEMLLREPGGRAVSPAPAAAMPAATPEPVVIHAGSLNGFVFVLLAALASVVFVASAAPLIVWQGDEAAGDGMSNLLRWPVLPIIIAMATTYVVATIVNRRFLDTLMTLQQGTDAGGEAPPGDYPR
jgi:pSer/pThr/pTyr-binding forkhead associated (FHA) protein